MSFKADGPTTHFMRLAHDLYTLQNHDLLEQRLVKRLKNKDQFQGARYEVGVAAAWIRAGFKLALENEADGSSSHCEFAATHGMSGAQYSVEAKSRPRPGVLGQPGQLPGHIPVEVSRLLRSAYKKNAAHLRVIFIDVNVPHVLGGQPSAPWMEAVSAQLKTFRNGDWPPAIVFITNDPYHFLPEGTAATGEAVGLSSIGLPEFTPTNPATLQKGFPGIPDVFWAMHKAKDIPVEWPDE